MATIASMPLVLLDHIFSFLAKPEQNTSVRKVCKTFQHVPFPVQTEPQSLVSSGKIVMGQGEYAVFHRLPTGKKLPLASETFEKVYEILLQHSPFVLGNKCEKRYDLLIASLKKIDPTLEAVFIPRTLYELVFIRKCIQEDLRHESICREVGPSFQRLSPRLFETDKDYQKFLKERGAARLQRKCWHLAYFTDVGDNEHAGVKNVAYRLNNVALRAFDPPSEGFTYRQLSNLAENEIEFLKNYYKNGLQQLVSARSLKGEMMDAYRDCNIPSPTNNFGDNLYRASKPMGIRHEMDAQIIRNAIALDCSRIAQRSFFLYRGAELTKDSISWWGNKDVAYSLSYGSSLFAGCVYDPGATAFYFMRNGQNGYAVPVPFDQLNDSLFFAPTTHFVAQLFGDGEIFHGRTKVWKGFDVMAMGGVNCGENSHKRDHLQSNLSKEELTAQFEAYKSKAIQLK
jgi:hypothetical protein